MEGEREWKSPKVALTASPRTKDHGMLYCKLKKSPLVCEEAVLHYDTGLVSRVLDASSPNLLPGSMPWSGVTSFYCSIRGFVKETTQGLCGLLLTPERVKLLI